jgi:hypothetical protein
MILGLRSPKLETVAVVICGGYGLDRPKNIAGSNPAQSMDISKFFVLCCPVQTIRDV